MPQNEREYLVGFLEKQASTTTGKSWVKYYCVVQEGRFSYFNKKNDLLPIGIIKISGILVERIDGNSFRIFCPEKTHIFQSVQKCDNDEWIACLSGLYRASKVFYHIVDNAENSDTKFKTIRDAVSLLISTRKLQVIVLRPGKYLEKDISVTRNLAIEAQENSTKDVQICVEEMIFKNVEMVSLNRIVFENSNIVCDAGVVKMTNCTLIGSGIELIRESLAEITNCTFLDTTYGVNLRNSSQATITDCKFNQFDNSIQCFNESECLVEGCTFQSTNGNSIYTTSNRSITMSKNKFVGNVIEVTNSNFIFIQNEFVN